MSFEILTSVKVSLELAIACFGTVRYLDSVFQAADIGLAASRQPCWYGSYQLQTLPSAFGT